MKRSIVFVILINLFLSLTAQYSVSGGSGMPLLEKDDSENRLKVYLLNGLSGVRISYESSTTDNHQWYRYQMNANNAVPVPSVQTGNTSYITDVQDGYGYFVGLPTHPLTSYVWIIDYSRYFPEFFNLEALEDDDKCEYLTIITDVEATPLNYNTPYGFPENLPRTYRLHYETLEWDENSKQFFQKEQIVERSGLISEIPIKAPLCDTYFTLSGDQFAEYFGFPQAIRSDLYQAVAVEAIGIPETTKEHAINELQNTSNALGGSAPIEYTFNAYANEPVAGLYFWKISQLDSTSTNGEMKLIVRYPGKTLRYNFEQDGVYLVELEVIGRNSVCVNTSQFFNVNIANTVIKIPNAFSPGSSIGVNDELRISFSSVMSFKASIYNKQGNLLFQWNDPTKGWDGRVNGKFVPTGVYYVIVEYKDSSGKSRSMSKAVNILRSKN